MRAHARIETVWRAGRTVLSTVRSDPPITLRATPHGVYWIGSAAGPLGGDDIVLDVVVGAGTALTMRSAAAAIALAGPAGTSRLRIDVTVGEDASLVWAPEPTIVTAGASHHADARLQVAGSAEVRWREQLVLGRTGERGGACRSRLRVDVCGVAAGPAGMPLLRHELRTGEPGADGPAVLDGARAVGTWFACGPSVLAPQAWQPISEGSGVLPLGPHALLATVLAGDAVAMAHELHLAERAVPSGLAVPPEPHRAVG